MKRIILAAFATAFTMAFTITGALAQNAPDPATMIQHRVQRLTALLGLTTDQQTQATTIFTTAQSATAPVLTSIKTARTSLQAAVKSNTAAAIDSESAQIGTLEGQLTDINAKADAAFYATLTADQKTKYDAVPGGGVFFGPGGARGAFRGARQ